MRTTKAGNCIENGIHEIFLKIGGKGYEVISNISRKLRGGNVSESVLIKMIGVPDKYGIEIPAGNNVYYQTN